MKYNALLFKNKINLTNNLDNVVKKDIEENFSQGEVSGPYIDQFYVSLANK